VRGGHGGIDEAVAGFQNEGGEAGCVPTTCEEQGAECDTIPDGCGLLLHCGSCSTGVCGLNEPNVCGCPPDGVESTTQTRIARRATSSGFAGTATDYGELYGLPCADVADCSDACVERGGTQSMCEASECLESSDGGECLPAPVWTNLESVRFEASSVADAIQLVVVDGAYSDWLLLDQFGFAIPDNALVEGIEFEVRRAGGALVADDSVVVLKAGESGSADRALSEPWSDDLEWAGYGAADDLWGEPWTPEEVNDEGFRLALSVQYGNTVGNTRAYVDQVSATVHYSFACE
jgi:hypothetical protein